MTSTHFIAAAAGILAGGLGGLYIAHRRLRSRRVAAGPKRILFPFAGSSLSRRALDTALRLARAERATLVPVFLVRVPLWLPLDSPVPRQCSEGLRLLETIEQRASTVGVGVDSRVARGRTLRHAIREAIDRERFDRVVVAAASSRSEGFESDDVAWLLDNAPGELVIIRSVGDDGIGDADGAEDSTAMQRV